MVHPWEINNGEEADFEVLFTLSSKFQRLVGRLGLPLQNLYRAQVTLVYDVAFMCTQKFEQIQFIRRLCGPRLLIRCQSGMCRAYVIKWHQVSKLRKE